MKLKLPCAPYNQFFSGNMGLLTSIFKKEISRVIKNDSSLSFIEIKNTDTDTLKRLQQFRSNIYISENPVLLKEIQAKSTIEEEINNRSFHFTAYHREKIVGTLRVTPYPFEMEMFTQSFRPFTQNLQNYLELNRLVVDPSYRNHGIGKKLSYLVYLRFYNSTFKGLVAICKKERAPTFERMGMRKLNQSPILISERNNAEYFLLASSWNHVMREMIFYYGGRVLKRWFTRKDPYKEKGE